MYEGVSTSGQTYFGETYNFHAKGTHTPFTLCHSIIIQQSSAIHVEQHDNGYNGLSYVIVALSHSQVRFVTHLQSSILISYWESQANFFCMYILHSPENCHHFTKVLCSGIHHQTNHFLFQFKTKKIITKFKSVGISPGRSFSIQTSYISINKKSN